MLRELLELDPDLYRAQYWYTQPIHFAVREGRLEAVRILLDVGADPAWVGLGGDDLVTLAQDRGHEEVASLLESRRRDGPENEPAGPAAAESPIHAAAEDGDAEKLCALLDADARLLNATDSNGRTPLRLADLVELLLERGAPTHLADDEPWATPLAWAQRRGHYEIVARLHEAAARA